MKKSLVFFVFFILVNGIAQIVDPKIGRADVRGTDMTNDKKDSIKININFPITAYKMFNTVGDTIAVDTILNIRKDYNFNYVRKDNFLRLPFQNMGQPYNSLSFKRKIKTLLPEFAASAKHFNYLKHNDIYFYNTPTPFSELVYKKGVRQGQMLDALIAVNINSNLNLSIGYKGITSLGFYRHSTTSLGRLSSTLNYFSKNKQYALKAYFVSHDVSNDENGGIKNINQFINSGDTYKDRGRIEVNFEDADNVLKGKRFYLGQEYELLKGKAIELINNTKYHKIYSKYHQKKAATTIFGDITAIGEINDSIALKRFENFSGLRFTYKRFLIQSGINYVHSDYRLDSIKEINGTTYPKILINNDLILASDIKFSWKKIDFKSKLDLGINGLSRGYFLQTDLKYKLPGGFDLEAGLLSASKPPDYKYIRFQSAYNKFNWYHPDFKNELIQELSGSISHQKWGRISLKQNLINNYLYFNLQSLPEQSASGIAFVGLQYRNDFKFGKFGFSTDLMLQQVPKGAEILHLPKYVARASIYYENYFYKRNLFIQTGITAKYFDAFYMNAYNPVLADFHLQETQKIGAFPLVDYFVNFKVKRFRFFFKLEHVNSLLSYRNPTYFSAPSYPYRDYSIRFGLRWIFLN